MIQFNDRKNATHELSLSVHDSGPGWNVWLAKVEGDTRYFEAADDVEVWELIDLAVHCYDEEPEREEYWDAMRENVFENNANKVDFLTVVDENGAPWFNVETAPKIEYPALYRKLLSPEEFTD